MRQKTYRRSKKKYGSSRSAWNDIAKTNKVGSKGLKTAHTNKSWVWKK